jgi:hypothetical protein
MSNEDIRQLGDSGPTIDSIQVQEFESQEAVKERLQNNAPAFLRLFTKVLNYPVECSLHLRLLNNRRECSSYHPGYHHIY